MLSIDEAIANAREVAAIQRNNDKLNKTLGVISPYYKADCIKCAEEHEQLAEWLEELKNLRELIQKNPFLVDMIKHDRIVRSKVVDDFADYLRMYYDKGMRLSVAMCNNEIEKFKLKALYSKFIDAIDDCVKAFKEMEQLKAGGENE